MLYGHGDNGYRLGGDIVADFSTNVWYGGEPAGMKEHLFKKWRQINRYPEVAGESLAVKAAHHHGLTTENILITSGTTESIYLIAQAYAGRRSGIVIPSFSEYEDACRMHGHEVAYIEWDGLAAPGRGDLVWLGNPNNPTGAVFSRMEHLISHHPDTLFILDEAFIEFTRTVPSAIPLLHRCTNLVVLRSLTKTFSIPGLRLGYIAATGEIITRLQSLKMPWSVNAMALEAGHFIFDHYASIGIPLDRLLQDRAHFVSQLRERNISSLETHTHFFICETPSGTARALQQYLLEEYRILIRNAGNFRGLSERHFRLATLAPHQNQLLITALEKWQRKCA